MRAWLLCLLIACSTPASATKFTGTRHSVISTPEKIETFADKLPPEGYRVIGVVTAQCAMLNGASGVLDGPCGKRAMLKEAKRRASREGGTALLDAQCVEDQTDRMLSRVDGGGAETSIRTQVICQATVLRAKRAAPDGRLVAKAKGATRRIQVSGTPVDVQSEISNPSAAREPADIGLLDKIPPGYRIVGKVWSACARGCSRGTARRALKHAAATAGAVAVAAISCQLTGDRWRCEGTGIGAASPPRDAGVSDSG